jgi:hypothetical protein
VGSRRAILQPGRALLLEPLHLASPFGKPPACRMSRLAWRIG